jgi:hypothetical protein
MHINLTAQLEVPLEFNISNMSFATVFEINVNCSFVHI